MGPYATVPTPEEAVRLAEERRQARVDAALQAGWVIRYYPERLEYGAARELLTARTLDELLDAVKGADDGR